MANSHHSADRCSRFVVLADGDNTIPEVLECALRVAVQSESQPP